tara:strand:- start:670 stop:825 length:156 start_codon:yes stop_codon:yes gene_type:complete
MSRYEQYQQVRKLNPDLFWDSKTQKQMQLDSKRMGEAFFKQQEIDFMEVDK